MKRIFILFIIVVLGFGNVYSQTKKAPVKRTGTNAAAKAKVGADAAEMFSKAIAEANAEMTEPIDERTDNEDCSFGFDTGEFVSRQGHDDYVVYEIPEMSAADLKGAVFTALTSMYKSPKDVITNLSDNMIQLEGYASDVYYFTAGDYRYGCDLQFSIIIQFKDGKVRYNKPTITQIYMDSPLSRKLKKDMTKPLSVLIDENTDRLKVENYFNELIGLINSKLKKSNDW